MILFQSSDLHVHCSSALYQSDFLVRVKGGPSTSIFLHRHGLRVTASENMVQQMSMVYIEISPALKLTDNDQTQFCLAFPLPLACFLHNSLMCDSQLRRSCNAAVRRTAATYCARAGFASRTRRIRKTEAFNICSQS